MQSILKMDPRSGPAEFIFLMKNAMVHASTLMKKEISYIQQSCLYSTETVTLQTHSSTF